MFACSMTSSAQTSQDSVDAELYFKTLNYDSLFYSMSLWSSTRDLDYNNSSKQNARGGCFTSGYGSCKATGACGTAKIYGYCNISDNPISVCDAFGNIVSKRGVYGTDIRNQYYVYLPSNVNYNSPVVVLIHGGGWFSGPNPNTTVGFPFKFAPESVDSNYVRDLLNDGYVVVSMIYRLSKLGTKLADWTANPVTWQDQINDIDAAITHIRTNFPTCLNIAANSIQVVGESAGGHLALMWAYTKAEMSYVKSVVAMYAPTNLNYYGDYLKNLYVGTAWENHTCGGLFMKINNDNSSSSLCPPTETFFPRYYGWDSLSTKGVYNAFPFNCHSPYISACATYLLPWPPHCSCFNSGDAFKSMKVVFSFNMLQSAAKQTITTPLTNTTLSLYSPKDALNSSRIVPTFIMHGESDILVPYTNATDGMSTKLSTTGGLINTIVDLDIDVPTTYTGPEKHLIKTYDDANHGWPVDGNAYKTDVVMYKIRHESITWLNGHK